MLRFGTGGVPKSAAKPTTLDGLKRLHELGLNCMELEFVHGVKLSAEGAAPIREFAEAHDIALTAHGPYYINLASLEPQKVGASRSHLLQTAKACAAVGAMSFTFHAAFYQGRPEDEVFALVKTELIKLKAEMDAAGVGHIQIRPELTGKPTQLGSLEELIRLSQEIEGVLPCIDFAHAHARSGGHHNTPEQFEQLLSTLERELGKEILQDMHIHLSGINYSPKGERNHLPIEEADLDWRGILDALNAHDVSGVVVCESPELEDDALVMQHYYQSL